MSLLHLAKLFLLVYSWTFYLSRLDINAYTLFSTHVVKALIASSEDRASWLASLVTPAWHALCSHNS